MPSSLPRLTTRAGFWLALFAAYFAAQALLRITLGDRVNIDEAEALLWAQSLDWGYGPQPPLYIWLQGAIFAVTGPGVTGLAVMKALVLWGIMASGFTLARRWVTPDRIALAGLATLALLWLPELSWESQRIRTHNTLAALIAMLCVLVLLHLRARPRASGFALLGTLFGLGLLAKWNFGILIPALLGALLLSPGGARVLLRPAALWLLLLPLVLIAPTGLWMLNNPEIALASMGKLGLTADQGPAWRLWLATFANNALQFAGLPALVLGLFALVGRRPANLPEPARAEMRLVWLGVTIALGLVFLTGLASGATRMNARWFLPLALPLLPLFGVRVAARLGPRARMIFAALSATLAALLLVASGVMLTRDPPLPGRPLPEMAAALPQTGADQVILAPVALAANLSLLAPERHITDAALLLAGPCPAVLTILTAEEPTHPGLAAFLSRCGLNARAEAKPLLSDRPELITPYTR